MKELLELFYVFLKLGLFTFGGGYAMIANIEDQVVNRKKWITQDEMVEIIAIAESTPGPIAINMATYIGFKRKKFLGALFATLGVVVPSLIIIYLISLFYDNFSSNQYFQWAFIGVKACVGFLIIKAGINLVIKMDKKFYPFFVLVVVISLMIVFELFNISFSSVYLILIGGSIEVLALLVVNLYNKKKESEPKLKEEEGQIIDNNDNKDKKEDQK
jgi:chromate transporter